MQHMQHVIRENLTKKDRISAVCRGFIHLQVLKTRAETNNNAEIPDPIGLIRE